MKRRGHLFQEVVDYSNLLPAPLERLLWGAAFKFRN